MSLKKSFLILIISSLICFSCLSVVAAQEDISSSSSPLYIVDCGDGLTDIDVSDIEFIITLDDEEIYLPPATSSKNIDPGNFTELKQKINDSDDVSLNNDYVNVEGLKYGITINKNTTINGNGHYIDANGQGRIFTINPNCSLTLIDITLKNGNIDSNGGAIFNKGTLIISNSTFLNNTAKNGGAIYSARGSEVSIEGCKFEDNLAKATILSKGGAIYCHTLVKCEYCIFNYNAATSKILDTLGGAIFTYSMDNCINCTFKGNRADNGGAIALMGSDTYNVQNCIFELNIGTGKQVGKGGAIYLSRKDANITIFHNQFLHNHANHKGDNVYNRGIYNKIERNYCEGTDTFRRHVSLFNDVQQNDTNPCATKEDWLSSNNELVTSNSATMGHVDHGITKVTSSFDSIIKSSKNISSVLFQSFAKLTNLVKFIIV